MNEISIKQFPINDDNKTRIFQEQKLLADIVQKLTNTKNLSKSINSILSDIGEVIGVNRVYIFEYSPDRKFTSNTYEWCAKGTSPQIQNLQNISYDKLDSWNNILNKKNIIVADDISKLPDELYKQLIPQKIKSILVLPIKTDDKVFGFVGFDCTDNYRSWNQNEIYLLETISGILSNVYFRQQTESKFETLFDLEKSEKSEIEQIRQNYESFFDSIDDFLFVLDQSGDILNVNETVTKRLGYTKSELIGKSILFIHPVERRDEAQQIVANMLSGKASVCPVPIISKNGVQIPVETRITLGTWNDEPVLFGVTKDISQIELTEEKFSNVFELNPSACGISGLDDHRYTNINTAFTNLLGYTYDDVIGKTATELGIIDKETYAKIASTADDKGSIINAEADIKSKNGDIKNVLLSSTNMHVQNKNYRFTVVNDITKRKKAELQLKLKEDILKIALQTSSEFLEQRTSNIDYSKFSDTIIEISGAEYASFNLFDDNGRDFTTVALSGINENLLKVPSILGFEIINKKWNYDPVRANKIKGNTFTYFDSLHDLSGSAIPTKISSLIEKIFNIGQVVIVNIQKNDIPIGDFTLLFSTSKTLTNQDVIELFVNQVSLLIDRTKSEIMISKNESRYRSYIDNSPIAVFICDKTGHYQQVNPAAEKITGYSKHELLSMSIADVLPPESQDTAFKLFQRLVEKGRVDAEFNFRRKDGSIGLWSLNSVRLSPTEFMGLCIDLTDRKKAEDDLLNSEQKFRTLIEQSPIAIEFYDSSGLLVNVNPACLKLFGIIDKKQIEKFALFDDPNISDDHKKMLAQAKPIHYEAMFDFDKVIEQKLYSTTKSGQIWLDVLITPTKDNADKANGYLVEIQDVSDKKTSITEMNDNLVKLEKMNSIMIGRELKMTELKAEIARLKQQIDR